MKNRVNNNNNEVAHVLISRLIHAGSEFKLASSMDDYIMANISLWLHHQLKSIDLAIRRYMYINMFIYM